MDRLVFSLLKKIRDRCVRQFGPRQCNVCGWRGWEFNSDSWHPFTICPICYCQVRHRLMVAAFQNLAEQSYARIVDGKRLLHFAPEPVLRELFSVRASTYVTADFLIPGHDLKLDMCNMQQIKDSAFDMLIACDVLEHVPNDTQALSEINRILSPGGTAVLTVPQIDGQKNKVELPHDATPEQRLQLAGQEDHQRIYGTDFESYLVEAKFSVMKVDAHSFSKGFAKRHCLRAPVLSAHPLATNHRIVYFATKPR